MDTWHKWGRNNITDETKIHCE